MFSGLFKVRTALVALWLFAVGAGFAMILNYQKTSGQTGPTPGRWPAGSQITLDPQRDTLVMFAHPQCPCTRASIGELNRVLARTHDRVTAHVFFIKPSQSSEGWSKTDLWRSAAAIPGVTVHEDLGGRLAGLFGAETSGDVLLYDTKGQLLFSGGITGSRGHAGDNASETTLISLCEGQTIQFAETPVFGCSLNGTCKVPPAGGAQ